MTEIYLHIDARMADYIRTHPYAKPPSQHILIALMHVVCVGRTGGHYYTYARTLSKTRVAEWYEYNDSYVSKMHAKAVRTPNAYVLATLSVQYSSCRGRLLGRLQLCRLRPGNY